MRRGQEVEIGITSSALDLTEDQRNAALDLWASGMRARDIDAKLGFAPRLAATVINTGRWRGDPRAKYRSVRWYQRPIIMMTRKPEGRRWRG